MQSRSSIHLQPSDDEVEEEGYDGEQVDEVHGAHEELQLARGTREPDLKQPSSHVIKKVELEVKTGLDFGCLLMYMYVSKFRGKCWA